jgi:HEAT repeat protein
MRQVCRDWLLEMRDAGFMPEGEMVARSKDKTIFDLIHDEDYPLKRILSTADIATSRDVGHLPTLIEKLKDEESIIRYWAVTGCLILGEQAKSAVSEVEKCLKDPSADVRITAAEFLCNMGETETALPVLIAELKNQNSKTALHATNSLHNLGNKAKPALMALKEAMKREDDNYIVRAATYTVEMLQRM